MENVQEIREMEFRGFGKIPRFSRPCVITEKIDGTNAQIYIIETPAISSTMPEPWEKLVLCYDLENGLTMFAGSRTRFITPNSDNHGFARWADEHASYLFELGPGRHFGEWWGQGINRGYGIREKRFSLFNTKRWGDVMVRPTCCDVVPVLFEGEFSDSSVLYALCKLRNNGSYAAPGFMDPEGVVIYHTSGNLLFKKTLKDDEVPKGVKEES